MTKHLIAEFTTAGERTIEWPPHELARLVDISIDVSGSGYKQDVRFQGRTVPLAEYNVRRFHSYLATAHLLEPGDQISVRLFGSQPGGQNIIVDEQINLRRSPLRITIDATIFTRRYNDRHLVVTSVERTEDEALNISTMLAWALAHLQQAGEPGEVYQRSPLLTHISQVIRSYDSNQKRLFVFVTDGHFHAGDSYFSPATFAAREVTPKQIKQYVEALQLKPFQAKDEKVQVMLFGLDHGNNEAFRLQQEHLLRWFFQPFESNRLLFR